MSKRLRNCTKEEITQLRRIMNQGFIDSDEDFELYKKLVEIKQELRTEGMIQ